MAVSSGSDLSCALRSDGAVECWGKPLPDGSALPGGSFVGVTVGGEHACALGTDGAPVCWGDNQIAP